MTHGINRRSMLRTVAGTCGALVATPLAIAQAGRKRPDPLDRDLVFEFVKVAHGNLDKTRDLLDGEPRLIKAAWDWGGGDFESALGAAGHMGRVDIASLLLDRGAPFELCPAAMLGQIAVVRAALETRPALLQVPGPHGISLVAHARAGAEAAAETLEFIVDFEKRQAAGGAAPGKAASALGGVYAGAYSGTFGGKQVGYEVEEIGGALLLTPSDGREPQEFEPAGEHRFEQDTFGVAVAFTVVDGRAVSFTANQGDIELRLDRVKEE